MIKGYSLEKWIAAESGKHVCKCGCGGIITPTRARYYQGKSLDFINLHQNRGRFHPNYKGGQVFAKGYIWILSPHHPRRTPRGYVKRCWLVLEKNTGKAIQPGELVHHINGDRTDDRPENLEIVNPSAHAKNHIKNRKRNNGRLV